MPKIRKKRQPEWEPGKMRSRMKKKQETNWLSLRELADELERMRGELLHALTLIDAIYKRLYTSGLDERGPITEQKDDIPF